MCILSCFDASSAGVWHIYNYDLRTLPEQQRYIHALDFSPGGGVIIVTFVPFLATLIHTASTLEVDTTFKRVVGELNEMELTIFYKDMNRSQYSLSLQAFADTLHSDYCWTDLYQPC